MTGGEGGGAGVWRRVLPVSIMHFSGLFICMIGHM